jgi:predicted deacetylase
MDSRLIFRFDDIGPVSRSTLQFIDLMETLGNPYLLGVIPNALSWWVKRRLRATRHAVIYQHGTTHKNRASREAPDEFPVELGALRIAAELHRGRHSLENALGIAVTGYVPPWNRVSAQVLQILEDEGYKSLSANSLHSTSLCQIPVHIDVYSQYQPVTVRSNADIESDIAAHLQRTELVGVVLHPLSVPRGRKEQLRELLQKSRHRMVASLP